MRISGTLCWGLAWLTTAIGLGACASTGRLGEYDFSGTTVAVIHEFPPYPEVLTGPYFPGHPSDPVHAILTVGGRIVKEVEAANLRPRLDSAAAAVDVAKRMADRMLRRVPRYLGATGVTDESEADFLFEIVVRDYGIDAEEWFAAAHFFIHADVSILERRTGVLVWEREVRERDPITPHIFGRGTLIRDVVTAEAFSRLEVNEIEAALEQLADYSADRISARLRDALDEVRSEQRAPVASSRRLAISEKRCRIGLSCVFAGRGVALRRHVVG